jgi:hypothetical protein
VCKVERALHSPVTALFYFILSLEEHMNIVQITSSLNPAEAEPTKLIERISVTSLADEPTRTLRSPQDLAANNKSGDTG